MSKNNPYDSFEEFLEGLFPETGDEEDTNDFGYYTPRRYPVSCDDLDYEGDKTPQTTAQVECRHEGKPIKKSLLNSVYYECQCGKYLGNKAPNDK